MSDSQDSNSLMKGEEFQRLLSTVLSNSGEVHWQSLSEKERRAVERFVWLHCMHPLHQRRIEETGLDYVWATVRQGPRLYGLA